MKRDTETHDRLLNLLTQYFSGIIAHSILERSLARCGLSADRLMSKSVLAVVEDARVGIGMFCEPARLPDLMLDLASFCEAFERPPPGRIDERSVMAP